MLDVQRLASSRPRNDPQILGGLVADSLHDDPDSAAAAIAASIEPAGKQALLRALAPTATTPVQKLEDVYVDRIFKQADFRNGDGLLDRQVPLYQEVWN